jgi:glutathione S-transferase
MTIPSWSTLFEIAQANTNAQWMHRPGLSPATAPISNNQSKIALGEEASVLLYKDTNSWCPYCERVLFALEEKKIPYQVEFIDLGSKPQWYLDLVPTGLVPAAKIRGELIYESKDILLALEEFAPALLPSESTLKEAALKEIDNCENNGLIQIGYKLIWGYGAASKLTVEEASSLLTDFEAKLEATEQLLTKYPGDYFMGKFSLVDIMYAPHLSRLAANLPVYIGYQLRNNERFPHLDRWFEAIASRPAYNYISSDSTTNNLVLRRIFGLQPARLELTLETQNLVTNSSAMEAAAKLSDNHQAIIDDIFKNSGIEAAINEKERNWAISAVDLHLRWLAEHLIVGKTVVGGRVGGKGDTDAKLAAIGAIALAYLRNRASAPRDMSAAAAIAFRSAIDTIFQALY